MGYIRATRPLEGAEYVSRTYLIFLELAQCPYCAQMPAGAATVWQRVHNLLDGDDTLGRRWRGPHGWGGIGDPGAPVVLQGQPQTTGAPPRLVPLPAVAHVPPCTTESAGHTPALFVLGFLLPQGHHRPLSGCCPQLSGRNTSLRLPETSPRRPERGVVLAGLLSSSQGDPGHVPPSLCPPGRSSPLHAGPRP